MELKTKDGMILVSEEEYNRLNKAHMLLPILRNSLSKTWRLIDRFDKLLIPTTTASAMART